MAFEWPETLQLTTRQRIASILWSLQRQPGGEVTDESGFATNALNDVCKKARVRQIPKTAPAVFPNLLANIAGERDGSPWSTNALIEREINGKRTYAIRLLLEDEDMPDPELAWTMGNMPDDVREAWYPEGEDVDDGHTVDLETAPIVGEDVTIDDIPEVDDVVTREPVEAGAASTDSPIVERLVQIASLATDLVIDVAALASHRPEDQVVAQLAWALDEISRLNGLVTQLTDENRHLAALVEGKTGEVAALQQAVRLTRANLQTMTSKVDASANGHDEDLERQRRELRKLIGEPTAVEP
jgi:hypothetical protein